MKWFYIKWKGILFIENVVVGGCIFLGKSDPISHSLAEIVFLDWVSTFKHVKGSQV